MIRNREMALYVKEHGGKVVVFWDGTSKGAKAKYDIAKGLGLEPVLIEPHPL